MDIKKFTQVSSTKLLYLQRISAALVVIGAFFVNWSLGWGLLSIAVYYLFIVVGIGVVLHRYWSHKSFEFKNTFLKHLFTFISIISARGSPIAWVHVHRTHHAHSDTDRDPHRPEKLLWISSKKAEIAEFKPFLVKDLLTKEGKLIHEYYFLFLLGWCLLLLAINPLLLYFGWILPVVLTQIAQDIWNYVAHTDFGYRNFSTSDRSRNVIWLWPLILGEAWHNNHHHSPKSSNMSVKWWEFDPILSLINIISIKS